MPYTPLDHFDTADFIILDVEYFNTTSIALPEFISTNDPEWDENVWSKNAEGFSCVIRATDTNRRDLDNFLISHELVEFTDNLYHYVEEGFYGYIWFTSIELSYKGNEDWDYPWLIRMEGYVFPYVSVPPIPPTFYTADLITTEDSYVDEYYPTTNFGSSWIRAGSLGHAVCPSGGAIFEKSKRIYIKFDLTAYMGKTIDVADIYLYQDSYSCHAWACYTDYLQDFIAASNVAANWTEGTITWNNKPADGGLSGASDIPLNLKDFPVWRVIHIKNMVQQILNGAVTNYGIRIWIVLHSPSSCFFIDLQSKEVGGHKPYLHLEWYE